MRYLLDVNAILACEHRGSPHHAAFHAWAAETGMDNLFTCAHGELGFIRVSMQAFGYSPAEAQDALAEIKKRLGGFVAKAPSPRLADWSGAARSTSDAYLAQVARENHLTLATFDGGIPGARTIGC